LNSKFPQISLTKHNLNYQFTTDMTLTIASCNPTFASCTPLVFGNSTNDLVSGFVKMEKSVGGWRRMSYQQQRRWHWRATTMKGEGRESVETTKERRRTTGETWSKGDLLRGESLCLIEIFCGTLVWFECIYSLRDLFNLVEWFWFSIGLILWIIANFEVVVRCNERSVIFLK